MRDDLSDDGGIVERGDQAQPTPTVRARQHVDAEGPAVAPHRPGVIAAVDARSIGLLVGRLGGGRQRAEDAIDPAVGLADLRCVGEAVGDAWPIAVVHARTAAAAETAAMALRAAVTVGDGPPAAISPPVLARIVREG